MDVQKGVLATAETFAAGILRVVEMQMEKAIRVIPSSEDTTRVSLLWLLSAEADLCMRVLLARALRIPRVLVPAMPGALSAVGILLADAGLFAHSDVARRRAGRRR